MKKFVYLIVVIVVLGLIVSGCLPVVPPTEQGNTDNLTKGNILKVPSVYPTIQAAINAASDGDTIIVANGDYIITAAINVNKGVTIIGNIANPENVLVKYSSAVTDKNCFDITVNNVMVQGIKAINGKGGFYLNGVTGCKVSNCIVSSCADKGIYVRKCAATSEAERVEVTSNVISDCGNTWLAACIQTYGSPYTYIYNNTINATEDKGINIIRSGATGTADRIQVIGNTISETKHPGIQVIGSPYTYVYDNTLTGCNYQGADETGDWDYASIHVQDDDQVSPTVIGDHVIIDSNTVSDGINGIQTWSNDVTIINNEIYDMGVTYGDEKSVGDRTYKNSGILVGSNWGSGDFDPTGVVIQCNNIHDNYWGLFYSADLTNGVNATYNWWGHPGGPRRPVGNSDKISGPKAADQVSENVLYHPWLNDEFEWQPTDVGGLVLWLDAGSIQGADGRPIGSWKDSSGQGNHAKQDDSTRQPTYIASAGEEELNSQPVVRFDGSNDWMYAPYESTLTEKTMFVVARFYSLGSSSPDTQSRVYVMGLAQINSGWHTTEFKSTHGNWRGRIYDGSGKWVEGSSVVDEQWKLLSLRAVNDEVIEFWEEGTSKGTTAIGTMWTEHNIVAIGANGAPVGFLNGDIAEILIFDRALSNHERQRIERYLNDKYDIY